MLLDNKRCQKQRDHIGLFNKVLETNVLAKADQKSWQQFWAILKNIPFQVQTDVVTF